MIIHDITQQAPIIIRVLMFLVLGVLLLSIEVMTFCFCMAQPGPLGRVMHFPANHV